MNRDPPDPVKRQLRQEVGFGCPVPGCRTPVLTYHHFDPPWSIQQHHNPDGMVALCHPHHAFAEDNGFTSAELRRFKSEGRYAGTVETRFPWAKSHPILRLGNSYVADTGAIYQVGQEIALGLSRAAGGYVGLHVLIRDAGGRAVARIHDNDLSLDTEDVHDLEVKANQKRVVLRFRPKEILLKIRIRPLRIDDFERVLIEDSRGFYERNPDIGSLPDSMSHLPPWRGRPGDFVGRRLMKLARATAIETDGIVFLMDVSRLSTYIAGVHVRVDRNGVLHGLARLDYTVVSGMTLAQMPD